MPNALIHSTSPYLKQHAHNPVNWVEWSDSAWELARKEDKLVLVSIGYSACHWCHVMEKESFDDLITADLMNQNFICIKIDREERPDIDQIYMDAIQLMTGRGGWPLNVFCLPDKRPIHGGTYFPNKNWNDTLIKLNEYYKQNKDSALEYADKLLSGIKGLDTFMPSSFQDITKENIDEIVEHFKTVFDHKNGGFSRAPKFPMPNNFKLLLEYYLFTKNQEALDMSIFSLQKMARGGLFDPVHGGFARYCVDEMWHVPHFEKMLYDNAQLLICYSKLFKINPTQEFFDVISKTYEFLTQEFLDKSGAFYSAYDADSEGEEGKYYVWTSAELKEILGEFYPLFSAFYSISDEGNWEHNNNILHSFETREEFAKRINLEEDLVNYALNESLNKLKEQAKTRVKPGLDNKIIACWNGLLLEALSESSILLNHAEMKISADNLYSFIKNQLIIDEELFRIYHEGRVNIPGFLEDYSAIINGLISYFKCTQNPEVIDLAYKLTNRALKLFYDSKSDDLFFSRENEDLIVRKRDWNDDVISSSASMFCESLLKLGHLFNNYEFIEIAKNQINKLKDKAIKNPNWYSNWVRLILADYYGFYTICNNVESQMDAIKKLDYPFLMWVDLNQNAKLPIAIGKDQQGIYLCRDEACMAPVLEIKDLKLPD